jgi:hypothetical protein
MGKAELADYSFYTKAGQRLRRLAQSLYIEHLLINCLLQYQLDFFSGHSLRCYCRRFVIRFSESAGSVLRRGSPSAQDIFLYLKSGMCLIHPQKLLWPSGNVDVGSSG